MSLLRKIGWLVLAVLLVTGTVSCKEEEEEEITKESMTGSVNFDIPYFVLKGETVTMSASGIIYPDDVYYKWYIPGIYADSLAANTITVKFPDSLATFTVSAASYSDGYYMSSNSRQVTTIDTTWNTSFQGLQHSGQVFRDERDGQCYRYVTLGDLDWFAHNANFRGCGVPYRASKATAAFFGSQYTWEEAMLHDVCPPGWRVPAMEDWESLASVLSGGASLPFVGNWTGLGEKASADVYLNGSRMWPYSPDNLHTNDFGWNAMPLGYSFAHDDTVEGLNAYGCWWCATERDADHGYYRYIWYDRGDFPMSYTGKKDMRIAVRCVRTHPQSL